MSDERRIFSVDTDRIGVRATELGDRPISVDSLPRAADSGSVTLLAELMRGTADGDPRAFTELYRATHPRVFGLALRVLRRSALAEEITQDVYLHVWKSAGQYDPRLASPIGWLMMLTHRRAVDRVRSESSAAARDLVYGQRHLGRDFDAVAEAIDQRSDERAVTDCLGVLTDTQRETVALAYYGARTYAEVAEHLGVPLNTVKTRIRDGLGRLRTCLTGPMGSA